MINRDIQRYIDQSVLCWLASVSNDMIPNVSPKEIFCSYQNKFLLVANIVSPQSIKNISQNKSVCVSFVDVLVQKGYQLKGEAVILNKKDVEYEELLPIIETMTNGQYPVSAIFKIKIIAVKKILAPSYLLYPNETTEEEQIKKATKQYLQVHAPK